MQNNSQLTELHTAALAKLAKADEGRVTRSKMTVYLNSKGCKGEKRESLISDMIRRGMITVTYEYDGRPGVKMGYLNITKVGRSALAASFEEKNAPA